MEEELPIDELYTEDLDEISQEEDNVIEEPEDDPQIPTEDQDSGEGGEQLPIEVTTIDEVEPDEEDVLNPDEENDLTEPEVAAEGYTPQPLVSNELTLPTIGSVKQGERVMIALINGEPTVIGTVGSGDANKTFTNYLDGRVSENTTALEDKADSKDVYSKEQMDDSLQEITANYKSEIKEAADQITQSIQEDYADKDSVTTLQTLITETATSWGIDFTEIRQALDDAVDAIGLTDQKIENLTTYVHVENEGSSPCLTLGSSDSDVTAALLNDRLEFRVKGSSEPVAYIRVDPDTHVGKLYITSAVVTSEMYFGYWKWYKRKNENLTLKWIGA